MNNQFDNIIHRTNPRAIVSLIAGSLSILPYLAWVILILFSKIKIMEVVIVVVAMVLTVSMLIYFAGIVFGVIGLFSGFTELAQVDNSQAHELNDRLAIIGIVLSILGIIANILFYLYLVIGILSD